MAGKLTEEQKASREFEIRRRYAQGLGMDKIADSMRISPVLVHRTLHKYGEARSRSEANEARFDLDIRLVSAERWRELYWSAAGGQASILMLSRQFGCSWATVKKYMLRAGVDLRGMSEQARVSFAVGRRQPPVNPNWRKNLVVGGRRTKPSKEEIRRLQIRSAESRKANRQIIRRPCSWCGVCLERQPWFARPARIGCCRSHAALARRFFERDEPGSFRPLIVAQLRHLLSEAPYAALPRSLATLEKAGSTIGATDAEYAEIMAEWAQG